MIRTCRRYASQIPQKNGPKPVPKPVDKLSPAEQLKAVDQRPPGLLDRLLTRIDNSRKEAEKAHIDRVNAGQKTRVNSAMMDKVGDYFDPEVQAKKRQELLSKAFEKGYWQDAREILKLGAKLWEAPNRLKPIKTCIEIPPIQGKLMSGETMNARKYTSLNSVTLVGIYFNAFGEGHVKQFVKRYQSELADDKSISHLEINVSDNWIKSPVVRLLVPYIKWRTPARDRSKYLMCYQDLRNEQKMMGLTNIGLGWVHLVDKEGKIRWQAHGIPVEHELQSMVELARKISSANKVEN